MPKQTGTQLSKRVCCGWLLCTPGLVEATAIEAVAALQRTERRRLAEQLATSSRSDGTTQPLLAPLWGVLDAS